MTKYLVFALLILAACAQPAIDPSQYVERTSTTVLDAPSIRGSNVAPINREEVDRGEYLVELLACGSCHTDGALVGRAESDHALAGSRIGIAFTTPLQHDNPAIVYAPNITPDHKTGIGGWTEHQIVDALTGGKSRHGENLVPVMPWQGYSRLSEDDAYSIASYLLHLDAISHRVPDNVPQGRKSYGRYVYFGVYEKK